MKSAISLTIPISERQHQQHIQARLLSLHGLVTEVSD